MDVPLQLLEISRSRLIPSKETKIPSGIETLNCQHPLGLGIQSFLPYMIDLKGSRIPRPGPDSCCHSLLCALYKCTNLPILRFDEPGNLSIRRSVLVLFFCSSRLTSFLPLRVGEVMKDRGKPLDVHPSLPSSTKTNDYPLPCLIRCVHFTDPSWISASLTWAPFLPEYHLPCQFQAGLIQLLTRQAFTQPSSHARQPAYGFGKPPGLYPPPSVFRMKGCQNIC